MSKNVQNEHALGLVIDPGDQPVVVAMNVEHRPSTHAIGVSKIPPHLGQGVPLCCLSDPIPIHQRDHRIRVPRGKS